MKCNICARAINTAGTCHKCESRLRAAIQELPELQYKAGFHLEPSRTGSGMASTERSIGINVSALDFHLANDLLATLHGWEKIIRKERGLTPPALLTKGENTDIEVVNTCEFHLSHLSWVLLQPWALQFAGDVFGLHARGRAATKQFKEQARRIPCPSDDCKKFVVIDVEQLTSDVSCFGCKQTWSVLRLVALAMSNPNKKFFLDVEAIALWLQIGQREVYRIIKKFDIERKGQTYDMTAIVKARAL